MNGNFPLEVLVDRQKATALRCPSRERLTTWVESALLGLPLKGCVSLTIRFVDEEEGQALNAQYRHKNYATNVLSFPYDTTDLPEELLVQERYLGDLVICAPVLVLEAKAQKKSSTEHAAHLVIHGVLHLLGHDHETELEAEAMEALEIDALRRLNIRNPYEPPE